MEAKKRVVEALVAKKKKIAPYEHKELTATYENRLQRERALERAKERGREERGRGFKGTEEEDCNK